MEKVRLGIIGIGSMGTGHAGNVLKGMVPDMELTAVADIRQSRLDWARNNLPETVKVFDDGRKMIDSGSCDAVLVATPHYLHPEFVIYALEHGLHAISEKPAGVYTKQVREMNEAAERSDRSFAIMLNQQIQLVRTLVQQHAATFSVPGCLPARRIIIALITIPVGDDPVDTS